MHPSLYLRSVSELHRNFLYIYSQGIKKFELINNASFAYTYMYLELYETPKHYKMYICIDYISVSFSLH